MNSILHSAITNEYIISLRYSKDNKNLKNLIE